MVTTTMHVFALGHTLAGLHRIFFFAPQHTSRPLPPCNTIWHNLPLPHTTHSQASENLCSVSIGKFYILNVFAIQAAADRKRRAKGNAEREAKVALANDYG